MSDEVKAEEAGKEAPATAATEIAYCPHLGIYHYRRIDGSEYLFDKLQLESAIDSYLKGADVREAEFMAQLTAFARQFPHQVVSFNTRGELNLRELLAQKSGDPEASEGGADEPGK
jgi:hypothetical protein